MCPLSPTLNFPGMVKHPFPFYTKAKVLFYTEPKSVPQLPLNSPIFTPWCLMKIICSFFSMTKLLVFREGRDLVAHTVQFSHCSWGI